MGGSTKHLNTQFITKWRKTAQSTFYLENLELSYPSLSTSTCEHLVDLINICLRLFTIFILQFFQEFGMSLMYLEESLVPTPSPGGLHSSLFSILVFHPSPSFSLLYQLKSPSSSFPCLFALLHCSNFHNNLLCGTLSNAFSEFWLITAETLH